MFQRDKFLAPSQYVRLEDRQTDQTKSAVLVTAKLVINIHELVLLTKYKKYWVQNKVKQQVVSM